MPGVQTQTRTLGHECMAMLDNLDKYAIWNGEKHRTPLALLGQYTTQAGSIAGLLRSGFNSNVVNTTKLQEESTGKVRSMILSYLPRAIGTEIETSHEPCTANAKDTLNEVTVDTSGFIYRAAKVTINKDEFLKVCENPDAAVMRRVMTKIDALLNSLDQALLVKLIAGAGRNIEVSTVGDTPDVTNISEYRELNITDANRNPKWSSVDQMLEDLEQNEWGAMIPGILFSPKGGFASFVRAEKIGCCNDAGQDMQEVHASLGFGPYKSKNVDRAFVTTGLGAADAANAAILLNPGSAHILEYWDNDHVSYNQGETFTTTWTDPFSMEKFDFEVQWDSCSKDYIITVYARKDVFTLPTDIFKTGDELAHTNGIMLYNMKRG